MSNEEVQETTETATDEGKPTILEVNTDTSINAPLDEVTDPETLKKMVTKLRSENAKTRTEKNATKEELAEFQAWKESQMSEAEKLQARLAAAEAALAETKREAIIAKFGLDEDLAEFVTGTEEEMLAKAERLATKVKASSEKGLVPDLFKTPGSETVKPSTNPGDDGAAFLAMLEAKLH